MLIKRATVAVLQQLDPNVWRTTLELETRVRDAWVPSNVVAGYIHSAASYLFGKDVSYDFISGPPLVRIHTALEELEALEVVEWRWREESADAATTQGGRRRKEWHLTAKGGEIQNSLTVDEFDQDVVVVAQAA